MQQEKESKNRIKTISWDFPAHRWRGITEEQIALWEKLYDHVDVIEVLRVDIPRWLDKKEGTKITRKRNWRSFICNWLKSEQIKGVGL
jgi:hypothetical protein